MKREKTTLQLQRMRLARAALSRWELRLTRALNMVQKLRRQVRYYSKELS